MKSLKKKDLIDFENNIIKLFNSAKIKAPVHLHSGNELQLIKIFKKIKKNDWVFSSWRSHYHCLLKGVPKKKLTNEILKGNSISLCFPEHKIYSSAIVGGSLPIAVGVALSIKRRKTKNKVWVFIGDMTYETGVFYECYKYAKNFKLPLNFIVEDNKLSTNTPTNKAWGKKQKKFPGVKYYSYTRKYPHHGIGKWILF